MLPEAVALPGLICPSRDRVEGVADAASDRFSARPAELASDAGRSAWTMPTFYLVPFICAYLLSAMWIIRGASFLRRAVSRG